MIKALIDAVAGTLAEVKDEALLKCCMWHGCRGRSLDTVQDTD